MLMNMFQKLTSIHWPASTSVRDGVSTGASNVVHMVMVMESATSPFARNVMTFDAVPPGTQPSRTRPTAICARTVGSPTPVRDSSDATSQPKPAMKTYWLQMPISTSVGFLRMYLKSSALSVMPMPNMMMPRKVGIWGARGFMSPGSRIPRNPMSTTPMDM